MREPGGVLVVGDGPASAHRLLGVVPADSPTTVLLLDGCDDAAAATLDCDEVVVADGLGPLGPLAAMDTVGPVVRPWLDGVAVLVVDDGPAGRAVAGWLATDLDAPLVWGVDELRVTPDGVRTGRPILGGTHRMVQAVDGPGPAVVIAKPAGGPVAGGEGRPRVRRVRIGPPRARVQPVEVARPDGAVGGTDADADRTVAALATAPIVVGIGRGIGGPEHVPLFRELADRLGGALGATRAVVDAGWVPFAHQVGQTGTAVAPDVYLAFGISGAIQHLAGMRDSRRVIAVNTDPDAAICRIADLVVTGDACRVARDLVARLPDRRSDAAAADGHRPDRVRSRATTEREASS